MRRLKSKICEICKKEFKQGYNVSDEKWKTIRFCSYKCRRYSEETRRKSSKMRKDSLTTPRKERHWNWKGGVTPEHNKLRGSLEYIIWRNSVYKRDNWTCRICGKHCKNGDIIAHHLKKFADFPELRFILENGLTICRNCHAEIENPQHIVHI